MKSITINRCRKFSTVQSDYIPGLIGMGTKSIPNVDDKFHSITAPFLLLDGYESSD